MESVSRVKQDTVIRFLVIAASVGVILLVLEQLSGVLVPFLQAAFVAVIAGQPVAWMRRRLKIPHPVAAILVGVVLAVAFILLGTFITFTVRDVGGRLSLYEERLDELLNLAAAELGRMGVNVPVDELNPTIDRGSLFRTVALVAGETGEGVTRAFFVVMIVVFMLIEAPRFVARMEAIFGTGTAVAEFEQFTETMNRYVVIKSWISLGTGTAVALLMMLIGVDYALLWGLIAFVLNYIPTVGSFVASIPPVVLALLTMGVVDALLVAGAFLLANVTFGSILEPRFLGSGLGINVPLILLSLAVWGWVFGLTGAFLAVPLTMTVLFVLARREETRQIAELLAPGASRLRTN